MNRQWTRGALALSTVLMGSPFPGQARATILGDFDHDCDVDSVDLSRFRMCALGAAIPQADPACADARLDADADVDLDDFGVFQRCYSGAGNPADPTCERPCVEGVCCPCGQTDCNGTCTSTASDEANCGMCGNTCATGLTCVNGACSACPADFTLCNGECVYLYLDNRNCGACGNVCPDGLACNLGNCEFAGP